ncbi:MAG: hypothetical protein ACREBU_03235 [Nitrososphaera sp.]
MAWIDGYIERMRAYAVERGVNPDLITGLIRYEGGPFTRNWFTNFSNPDPPGIAYGPFQLHSNYLAKDFMKKYGFPSMGNVDTQGKFSIDIIAKGGLRHWHAVRDQGYDKLVRFGQWWRTHYPKGGGNPLLQNISYKESKFASAGVKGLTQPPTPKPPISTRGSPTTPGVKGSQTTPQDQGRASVTGDVLSGMWEAQGVTAVTTAGKVTSEATTRGAETVRKGAQELGREISESEQRASTTAQNIALWTGFSARNLFDRAFDNIRNLFVRSGLLLLGLAFMAGAVYYFSTPSTGKSLSPLEQ